MLYFILQWCFAKFGFNRRLIHKPHIVAKDGLCSFYAGVLRYLVNKRQNCEPRIPKLSYILQFYETWFQQETISRTRYPKMTCFILQWYFYETCFQRTNSNGLCYFALKFFEKFDFNRRLKPRCC